MPKRRTFAPKKRPHPKMEEGPIDENIDPDDKTVKVDLLLRDFDKGVECRIKDLETRHRRLLRTLTQKYHLVRKTYTKDILNMNIMVYLESLGSDEADISNIEEEEDEAIDKVLQTVHKKRGRRNMLGLGIIDEQYASDTGTTRKRTIAASRTMAPPVAPPTGARNKFQTPAVHGVGRSRAGWETPMVTPKFDPRLPVTTARRPKRGECELTSVFMSAKGSPIHASQPLLTIPTANNPNQGISFMGNESYGKVQKVFESCDPQMKENLKKMAKLIVKLTENN